MENLKQWDILWEDADIMVVYKPAGLATQTSRVGQPDLVSELKNHLQKTNRQKGKPPYLALIHRLDQPVEGILVFAKTKEAAAQLNSQLKEMQLEKQMKKHYLAAVCGTPPSTKGTLEDYLVKEEKTNTSSIVPRTHSGAKKAVLSYEVLQSISVKEKTVSLVSVHLMTGRHHQIRVQMKGAGMPLLGDQKYNDPLTAFSKQLGIHHIALCASRLSFDHPRTRERLSFAVEPKGKWYMLFDVVDNLDHSIVR